MTRKPGKHSVRHMEHWTAISTLLGIISSLYRDLHHWRSNQQQLLLYPLVADRVTIVATIGCFCYYNSGNRRVFPEQELTCTHILCVLRFHCFFQLS